MTSISDLFCQSNVSLDHIATVLDEFGTASEFGCASLYIADADSIEKELPDVHTLTVIISLWMWLLLSWW